MDTEKRKKLETAGWKVGSTADFLELTPEESESLVKMGEERQRKGKYQLDELLEGITPENLHGEL